MTGIDASLCQLVNDDAGNLIGVVKNVGLYRWTTVEGAPQKVANVTPGANKVSAIGDIDKVGYVYDSKPDGVGTHAVYKFENGTYTGTSTLVVPVMIVTGDRLWLYSECQITRHFML